MAWSTGAKVAVGIVGGLVLLAGGTCGGFAWWLNANKETLQEQGKAVMREGASFGSGRDADACVTEGVRRLAHIDGIVAEATNKIFVESCLKTARLPPDFCAGVPPRDEIMQSATWAVQKCAALSTRGGEGGDQACTRLVGAIQERCIKPRAGDPP